MRPLRCCVAALLLGIGSLGFGAAGLGEMGFAQQPKLKPPLEGPAEAIGDPTEVPPAKKQLPELGGSEAIPPKRSPVPAGEGVPGEGTEGFNPGIDRKSTRLN